MHRFSVSNVINQAFLPGIIANNTCQDPASEIMNWMSGTIISSSANTELV